MQQTTSDQPKRYQFFPRERQLPVLNSPKAMDTDKLFGTAALLNDRIDKPSTASSLKNKFSQHSLVRRRKISVPELGPMTTVQEVPMDSRMLLSLTLYVHSRVSLTILCSYDSGAAATSRALSKRPRCSSRTREIK
jgi:hypothetical protein